MSASFCMTLWSQHVLVQIIKISSLVYLRSCKQQSIIFQSSCMSILQKHWIIMHLQNQILLDKFNFFSDTLIHVQTTGLKGHFIFFPICVNSRTCIFGLFKNVWNSVLKMIKDMQLTKNCKIGIYNNQACNGCTLYVNNLQLSYDNFKNQLFFTWSAYVCTRHINHWACTLKQAEDEAKQCITYFVSNEDLMICLLSFELWIVTILLLDILNKF